MPTVNSLFEMIGPAPFALHHSFAFAEPGRPRWENIGVQQGGKLGMSVTELSSFLAPVTERQQPIGPTHFQLEMTHQDGQKVRISIPFLVTVSQDRVFTLASKNHQTPWRFLIKLSSSSKELTMKFTLSYAGLSIEKAMSAMEFYEALTRGGKLRLSRQHPITGGDIEIATARLPAGSFGNPDHRLGRLLRHLAVIQEKTGRSLIIPDQPIGFEEANLIAATAQIVKTGHAQYTAQPWVIVSPIERATVALERFASGEPIPTALHYDSQETEIFGTRIPLGPVTFFCERTHITKEDLADAARQLKLQKPGETIKIRFTPLDACPIEARYMFWLPTEEAEEMRHMPMYATAEPEQARKGIEQLASAQGTKPLSFEQLLGNSAADARTDVDSFLNQFSKWRSQPTSRRID